MDRTITFLGSPRGKFVALGTVGVLFAFFGVTFAQNTLRENPADNPEEVVEGAEENVVWNEEIQREAALQRQQHAERLGRLVSLKDTLTEAGVSQEAIDAVNRAIAEEQEDYEARLATLQRWRSAADRLPMAVVPAEALWGEIGNEYRDAARAIGSLNQSFVIPPVRGGNAVVGGSVYIDRDDPRFVPGQEVPLVQPPVVVPEGEVVPSPRRPELDVD